MLFFIILSSKGQAGALDLDLNRFSTIGNNLCEVYILSPELSLTLLILGYALNIIFTSSNLKNQLFFHVKMSYRLYYIIRSNIYSIGTMFN